MEILPTKYFIYNELTFFSNKLDLKLPNVWLYFFALHFLKLMFSFSFLMQINVNNMDGQTNEKGISHEVSNLAYAILNLQTNA